MAKKSTVFCDAAGSRLNIGTSTSDKKTIPPIQLTTATRWSHTIRAAPIIDRRYLEVGPWLTCDWGVNFH